VPERLGVAVEALAVEFAIALETTGDMPPLTADKLDQPSGSAPTVELDIYLPPLGQERGQFDQDLAGDAVLAAKGQALFFGPLAIEPTHCLFPQIEPQVDGGHVRSDPHGTDHIAEAVLVARFGFGAFAVVEEPIDRLQMAGVLVSFSPRESPILM